MKEEIYSLDLFYAEAPASFVMRSMIIANVTGGFDKFDATVYTGGR